MAFTLNNLVEIIDNCIEDGKQMGIACDKHVARIIERYLDEYDMDESFNILYHPSKPFHFEKIESDCLVVINCRDEEYEYYIDYYKLNEKLPMTFDEFILIGEQFKAFDMFGDSVKSYSCQYIPHIEINDEDIADIFADEFDYEDCNGEEITQEEHDRWVKAETCDCDECCGSCDEELECECVDCSKDTPCQECEFNNISEECNCEECIGKKTITEEEFIILVTEAILSRNGCFDCTLEIVENLVDMMKVKGWEAHREYIRDCNEEM